LTDGQRAKPVLAISYPVSVFHPPAAASNSVCRLPNCSDSTHLEKRLISLANSKTFASLARQPQWKYTEMPPTQLPIEVVHDQRKIRSGVIAGLIMVVIGISLPVMIARFSDVPFTSELPLLITVSGGLIVMGGVLGGMCVMRIIDPIYLAISKGGEGKWRPFFRVRHCQFPIEAPIIEDGRMIWSAPLTFCATKQTPDGRYYIELPVSVKIAKSNNHSG